MDATTEKDLPKASETERARVSDWVKRIQDAKSDAEEAHRRIERNRKYVEGRQHDDGSGQLVRANFLFGQIKIDVSRIYARNPQLSVTPHPQVVNEGTDLIRRFSRTCENLLNRQISEAKMKRRGKQMVRATKTGMIAWVKAIFQQEDKTDPIMTQRLDDAQDNIRRAKALGEEIEKGPSSQDNVKKDEFKRLVDSVNSESEVFKFQGWVFETVPPTDLLLPFHSIQNFEDYAEAPWMAQRVWMSKDDFRSRFGFNPSSDNLSTMDHTYSGKQAEMKNERKTVEVWEIWNRIDKHVYTITEGTKRFLREPYIPDVLGKRFFPFFGLQLDSLDENFWGTCTVELLQELQDELNDTRTKFKEMRSKIRPFSLVRKGRFDEEELTRMQDPDINELIEVYGTEGQPLSNDFAPGPNILVDPSLGDTSFIKEDWDQITQGGEAPSGFIRRSKTATEANQLLQGVQERASTDNDGIDEMFTEIGEYMLEIDMQLMTPEQVEEIAGTGSIWPQFDKEKIFRRVFVNVRAGSSGKPNKAQEQENWIRFFPEISNVLEKISQLRAAGQNDLADSLMKLQQEGLRRFDETLDIREFFPGSEPQQAEAAQNPQAAQADQDPQQAAALQQKAQQQQILQQQALQQQQAAQALEAEKVKAQIEKTQAEIQKTQAEVEKTQSESLKNKAMADKTFAEVEQTLIDPETLL